MIMVLDTVRMSLEPRLKAALPLLIMLKQSVPWQTIQVCWGHVVPKFAAVIDQLAGGNYL